MPEMIMPYIIWLSIQLTNKKHQKGYTNVAKKDPNDYITYSE